MTHNSLITVRYGTVVMENQPGPREPYMIILGGMAGDTSHILVVASIIHSDRLFLTRLMMIID
jgi:hypothetical protein